MFPGILEPLGTDEKLALQALGQGALQWYLAWSFPYALLAPEPNLFFFATLPIALYLLNTQYEVTPLLIAVRAALIFIPTVAIALHILKPKRPYGSA